jgi:hypothetical protein
MAGKSLTLVVTVKMGDEHGLKILENRVLRILGLHDLFSDFTHNVSRTVQVTLINLVSFS